MKTKNNKSWTVIHEESAILARWMALYEAINIIADASEKKNISFEKNIKPIAISKYIKSTENMYLRKILEQNYNIDFYYEEELNKVNS
jgi:hypothetical protein